MATGIDIPTHGKGALMSAPYFSYKMWYYKVFILITLGWAVFFESPHTLASTLFPEDKWQRISPPESAGFSSEKLKMANNLFSSQKGGLLHRSPG